MDTERLKRLAATVRKCIQYQEVTETSELMDPTNVTLNIHYNTANGEHNPNPNVAPRTYTGYLAATQALRDGQQLHYPPIPVLPKEYLRGIVSTAGSAGTTSNTIASQGSGAAGMATVAGGGQGPSSLRASQLGRIPNPTAPPHTLPALVIDVMSPCQRLKGLIAVSQHTFEIYKWLLKGRDIADPKVHTEVRRARKVESNLNLTRKTQGGLGATTNTLASTLSPRNNTANSSPSAEEQGDDRQFLSVVVVLYGRVNFLIQDEMYFTEDGALVLIDRFLVQPVDEGSAQYLADKASFFKLGRSQVDRTNEKHPVIDFSFKGLKDPIDALRVPPISGATHQPRPIFKPPTQEKHSEAVTFSAAANAQQSTRKLIVAKNRKGEEEAYEFEIKAILKDDNEDKRSEDEILMQQLASKLANKYDGEVVRLCNNNMAVATNLAQVLRNLVANHFLTIQWIDLSNNQLSTVPDLSSLPLTTLYLHANRISDWKEIEERVCTLPQLTSLTCHGNPIATKDKDYKQQLLMRLQKAKSEMAKTMKRNGCAHLVAPIKLIDFVAISACDTHVATMYSVFSHGGTLPLLPKFPKDGTVSPRSGSSSPRKTPRGGDFQGDSPRYMAPRGQSPRR